VSKRGANKIVISANRQSIAEALREAWEYRDLFYLLVRKQVSVRYRQTVLGILWAVIQPLLAMAIFSQVFGRFVQLPSGGIPYPLFAYSGLVLWTFFAQAVARASSSLLAEERLVGKVYFPRYIVPLSAVGAAAFDFLVSFALLMVVLLFYRVPIGFSLVYVPPVFLLAALLAAAIGLTFAALSVKFRDVQQVLPFVIQLWMYASPVVYSLEILSAKRQALFYLNPISGILGVFRFSVLGGQAPDPMLVLFTVALVGIALGVGFLLFFRVERDMVDYL
jgi:lipopolysaccharide transport system permease protein